MGFFSNGMLHMHPPVIEFMTSPSILLLQWKEMSFESSLATTYGCLDLKDSNAVFGSLEGLESRGEESSGKESSGEWLSFILFRCF